MKGGEGRVEEVGGEEVEGAVGLGGTEVMDEGVGFVQEDVVVDIIINYCRFLVVLGRHSSFIPCLFYLVLLLKFRSGDCDLRNLD
jgi:hypothetical protein